MPSRPIFQRAPRIIPYIPSGEVEIPAPPVKPASGEQSIMLVLLPRLLAVVGLAATVLVVTQGSSNWVYIISPLAFTVVSLVVAILTYTTQRKASRTALKTRESRYRALLDVRRRELSTFRDQQLAAGSQTDPSPLECISLADRRDIRMWQRSPRDADFLMLRVGQGSVPLTVKVKAPRDEGMLEADPLLNEAQALAHEMSEVPRAPISLSLREAGAAGISGERSATIGMARALAVQIATHNSPDEVKICAFFPAEEARDWDWMRWLPHTWTDDGKQRLLASDVDSATQLSKNLYAMLSRRHSQIASAAAASGKGAQPTAPLPNIVVFLADALLVENAQVLQLLLHENQALGAYPVFLSSSIEDLPRGCQAIIALDPLDRNMPGVEARGAELIVTAPAPQRKRFVPDSIEVALADSMARRMAPVRLRRIASNTELPNVVPLINLLDIGNLDNFDVFARWQAHTESGSLAVPIGRRSGDDPLILDLDERAHGPHGLVAGATGSGKSELLQALVASLAVNFHPHEVTFVLVDYKGGGMSNVFGDLPHLVGTITNLEGGLIVRVLSALKGELQRRQALLAQVGENHIDKYQQRYWEGEVTEPLPHLVIVIDEFAELAQSTEVPDFMKQLIATVRVGRSLGVHLILATQKPAGIVNEQIWSNARFRICLRVERAEDSREVIRRPDAANLTHPGRAYFQVGNDEVFELFQSGWGGAPYAPDLDATADDTEVMEVVLDGSRRALRRAYRPAPTTLPGKQLEAIVAHLARAASEARIKRLPGLWMPPLPEAMPLGQLRPQGRGWDMEKWRPERTWISPIVGLLDDPSRQRQDPLHVDLGKEGHLAIYGAPGTGKTTFLQALVTSLTLAHSPQDVNLYMLDFAGRSLSVFAGLPHVGGVILPNEGERVNWLARYLLRQMDSRQERFANAGVNTLPAYRDATKELLPAIVVVVDNYPGFAASYPDAEEILTQVARNGSSVGIHLVLTANSPVALKTKVSGNITLAVALQLADKSDYVTALQRSPGIDLPQIAGRGLVKGTPPLEFQTALPIEGDTEAGRTVALRSLVNAMSQAWRGPRAQGAPVLPDKVALSDFLIPQGGNLDPLWSSDRRSEAPLALETQDLDILSVDLADGPHFVVSGPPQSGKTTLLQTWALALAERCTVEQLNLIVVDFRRDGLVQLQALPHVQAVVGDESELNDVITDVMAAVLDRRRALENARKAAPGSFDEREFIARYPTALIVIDDFDTVRDALQPEAKAHLEQLIKRERGLGFHIVVAGTPNDLGSSWDAWVKALREGQTGFVLGSTEQDDTQVLGLRLPFGESGKSLPAGQGYYVRRGRGRRIKVATPQAGNLTLAGWVARISGREAEVG